MKSQAYVIGVDYGTDSVRSVIVNAFDGQEVSSSIFEYPRWKDGLYCDPKNNQFRQHPLDYIEGFEKSILGALSSVSKDVAANVKGISIDTTGSTPVALDKNGLPLSLSDEFKNNPNAMFVLWKDHTSVAEAEEINNKSKNWGGIDFTKYVGGVYSSEWFWAKMLHIMRTDSEVRERAFTWAEHCDWMTAYVTGNCRPDLMKRSRCSAGHKAMWHSEFNGLPSEEFLVTLDPMLKGMRSRLFTDTYTSDIPAGTLTREWADKLGLSENVIVGVGAFDAHMGAVGGEIEPYYLSKVIGTSTCDMLVAPREDVGNRCIRGICGQVDGSVIPGMIGMEAGQSAFGDSYAWFRSMILSPVNELIAQSGLVDSKVSQELSSYLRNKMIPHLEKHAEKIPIGESEIVALDWLNGRRTPDANQALSAVFSGLSLGSDAPRIFRAIVESTAFGAKAIVDRFISEGIPIKGVIALGGVAKKSPFVMQTLSDVFNMKIKVVRSEQACALGAAMFAATAAGLYPDVMSACKAMGNGFEREYNPIDSNAALYKPLYARYRRLGEYTESEISSSRGNG